MIQESRDLLATLERLMEQFLSATEGLPAEALDWKPGTETNAVAAILTHGIGASRHWLVAYVGKGESGRDREAEFRATGDAITDLAQRVQHTLADIRRVLDPLTTADLDARCEALTRQQGPYQGFTNREAILHVIEHLGTHVGHLELTIQLWRQTAVGSKG